MIKKIACSLLAGIIIMALLTALTFRGTKTISDPQLAGAFSVTFNKHGLPFTYQTTYANSSGIYGSEIPKNTGLRLSYLATDWLCWSFVAFIASSFIKHPAKQQSKRQEPRRRLDKHML